MYNTKNMANGFAIAEKVNGAIAGTGAGVSTVGLFKLFAGFTPMQKQILPFHNDPVLDNMQDLLNADYESTLGAGLLIAVLALSVKGFTYYYESRLNER